MLQFEELRLKLSAYESDIEELASAIGLAQMKRELAGVSTDEGGDHWSYGAGAEFKLNEDNGIRADWTRREFKGDRDSLDAYSVNYVRRF